MAKHRTWLYTQYKTDQKADTVAMKKAIRGQGGDTLPRTSKKVKEKKRNFPHWPPKTKPFYPPGKESWFPLRRSTPGPPMKTAHAHPFRLIPIVLLLALRSDLGGRWRSTARSRLYIIPWGDAERSRASRVHPTFFHHHKILCPGKTGYLSLVFDHIDLHTTNKKKSQTRQCQWVFFSFM